MPCLSPDLLPLVSHRNNFILSKNVVIHVETRHALSDSENPQFSRLDSVLIYILCNEQGIVSFIEIEIKMCQTLKGLTLQESIVSF